MAVLIIPIAISVHTIISWILATTVQPGWHSTVFGPYFVVGAIFSGIGALFIAMTIMRRIFHLEAYITGKQYQYLGYLLTPRAWAAGGYEALIGSLHQPTPEGVETLTETALTMLRRLYHGQPNNI